MRREDLIAFEKKVEDAFNSGVIHAPVHLSGGNEEQLIGIFKGINYADYVFSTHRSHYHALLHGVPEDELMKEILAGHSMNLQFPHHRFYTSAIVGGILPIALGMAMGIKLHGLFIKVYCFVGDMAATTGIFHECKQYAIGHDLPIIFVVEDNDMSTDTPTEEAWGKTATINTKKVIHYHHKRVFPHVGTGKKVSFV